MEENRRKRSEVTTRQKLDDGERIRFLRFVDIFIWGIINLKHEHDHPRTGQQNYIVEDEHRCGRCDLVFTSDEFADLDDIFRNEPGYENELTKVCPCGYEFKNDTWKMTDHVNIQKIEVVNSDNGIHDINLEVETKFIESAVPSQKSAYMTLVSAAEEQGSALNNTYINVEFTKFYDSRDDAVMGHEKVLTMFRRGSGSLRLTPFSYIITIPEGWRTELPNVLNGTEGEENTNNEMEYRCSRCTATFTAREFQDLSIDDVSLNGVTRSSRFCTCGQAFFANPWKINDRISVSDGGLKVVTKFLESRGRNSPRSANYATWIVAVRERRRMYLSHNFKRLYTSREQAEAGHDEIVSTIRRMASELTFVPDVYEMSIPDSWWREPRPTRAVEGFTAAN